MNDYDEFTAGSNCILGMMVNGKSQHHSMFDWTTDHSGTFPANHGDLVGAAWGEDVTVECEEEESQLADLQRDLAEDRERSHEMLMSMIATTAAADQVAMEGRREAERKAAREAEKASRAQAETDRAALGVPMGSAVDTKSTCEHRGSVRGRRAAATRPRIPEGAMTKKAFVICGILDSDAKRGTVLVRCGNRHGASWEPRGMIHDQFDRESWTSFMDEKLRKKRELHAKGFVGAYVSGTELGYANEEMVLAGVHPETAAVGHPLQKVTGRRGIANSM
jgi:hypothetical protein